ncbi:MAG: hypothetical protein WBM26_01225, partial [Polyangiales bacterium]
MPQPKRKLPEHQLFERKPPLGRARLIELHVEGFRVGNVDRPKCLAHGRNADLGTQSGRDQIGNVGQGPVDRRTDRPPEHLPTHAWNLRVARLD